MSDFDNSMNIVLLEAEERLGTLMLGDNANTLPEEEIRLTAREFLNAIYQGQTDINESELNTSLNNVLSQSGAGSYSSDHEEMFELLREKLISGDYTREEPAPEQAQVIIQKSGHNEITESILNNVAETMGGKDSGWDTDKVKETVSDMTSGNIPEGDFKESFQAAVVDAYTQAPGGEDMTSMLEHRSSVGGQLSEERMENLAVNQLNGMINAAEQSQVPTIDATEDIAPQVSTTRLGM